MDIEKIGKWAGYFGSYSLFTIFIFFLLNLTHKISPSWTFFHVLGITFLVILTGMALKRFMQ